LTGNGLSILTRVAGKSQRAIHLMGRVWRVAGKRKGSLRDWLLALLARKPAGLATVALANKLAQIISAVMTAGEAFRTETFERA
jgi:transposase